MAISIERITIVVLFAILLFMQMCKKPNLIAGKTNDVIHHSIDTITEIDTIKKVITKHHYHLQAAGKDTIFLTPEVIAKMDTFSFPIKDSILTANITVLSETQPVIDFDYKVTFFEIREKITIKDSLVVQKNKNEFYLGALIGGSNKSFMIAPMANIKTKNGFIVGAGYDVINQNVILGFSKKIQFFKK